MLVAIDASPAMRPRMSGTERYTRDLILALARSPDERRIRLYANASLPPAWLPDRVEWRGIPFPRMWTHLRFARSLAADRPDVVFVPGHVLPFYLRQPAVVTIHDVGHREQRSSYSPSAWLYLEATTRWMARTARFLVAVSQHTANQLRRFYHVPTEKIAVIPSGVDPNMRPQSQDEVQRVKLAYGLSLPYFLYVGRNHPRKNLRLLAQAYASAREQGLQAEMVLAGAEGFPGQAGLKVLAYVQEKDLSALYSGSTALVLPSKFEGFGFPVLEAMRCDTPVISSNAGALPEIVRDAGILLSPDDREAWTSAMLDLARNGDLRASLIERGRKNSADFTWDRTADSLWKVLDHAAASR